MDYLVDFEKLPWVQVASGMRCKSFTSGTKQIRLIELSENFQDLDWCVKSHTNYIIEGALTSDFEGKMIQYKKGDVIYIPEGKKHKAIINQGEKVLMLDF